MYRVWISNAVSVAWFGYWLSLTYRLGKSYILSEAHISNRYNSFLMHSISGDDIRTVRTQGNFTVGFFQYIACFGTISDPFPVLLPSLVSHTSIYSVSSSYEFRKWKGCSGMQCYTLFQPDWVLYSFSTRLSAIISKLSMHTKIFMNWPEFSRPAQLKIIFPPPRQPELLRIPENGTCLNRFATMRAMCTMNAFGEAVCAERPTSSSSPLLLFHTLPYRTHLRRFTSPPACGGCTLLSMPAMKTSLDSKATNHKVIRCPSQTKIADGTLLARNVPL